MLMGLMRAVTGDNDKTPINDVAEKIQANPKLMVELERVAIDRELGLAKVEASKLETVNLTMRIESKSDHFLQWAWRPFNGILYGISMFMMVAILPMFEKTVPEVTAMMLAWSAVLGVAVVGRNKEKASKSGGSQQQGMVAGIINAIKGS